MVGQQREGNDAAVLAEVLARVTRLDGRIGRAEFLSVNAAVENLQVKRVVRKDGQLGDEIADLIVRRFQRGQAQVLLMGGFQHVIRNVAGLGHAEIAVVHRLGDDHRPIGSIPRPDSLVQTILNFQAGKTTAEEMEGAYSEALRDTIERLEQTGSPVITDGEQTKSSFATYPLSGLTNLAPDGVIIPFADGHTRQLPRLTAEPFRYGAHAAIFVKAALEYTKLPIKQAVISASALSLLYPSEPISGFSREAFIEDLIDERS